MSSTLNPTQIDPKDIPTLAPEVVVTRADSDLSKAGPDGKTDGKTASSAPQKGAGAAAGVTVPALDTAFRAAATGNVSASGRARRPFGRRLMRGVIGMILTACIAGAAVLWQSHGGNVGQIVAKWLPSSVLALLSPPESPAVEQPSAAPAVEVSTAAPPPPSPAPAPASAAEDAAANPASPSAESAQLLQSMARDLADLRQDMEQMKANIAELRAGQDQMAREVAKASEQNLRSRMPPPPVLPARKLPAIVRPVQPRAAAMSPQAAASYMPRRVEPRAVAPPPMDLSAPRPPGLLREQMP
jgi:hypothetical protein